MQPEKIRSTVTLLNAVTRPVKLCSALTLLKTFVRPEKVNSTGMLLRRVTCPVSLCRMVTLLSTITRAVKINRTVTLPKTVTQSEMLCNTVTLLSPRVVRAELKHGHAAQPGGPLLPSPWRGWIGAAPEGVLHPGNNLRQHCGSV